MLTKKEQQILNALEPHSTERGVEIVSIEIVGSSKAPVIRVYIDTENGVSFKELTEAQEWIGEFMDALDPFPGAYTMEVSSPGIDRPLRTAQHFEKFLNEEARIRTSEPISGQSNFTGVISEVKDDLVILKVDGNSIELPLSSIRKANLIGKIDF